MESMLQGEDHSSLLDDVKSASPLSGERVIIHRYVSTTATGTVDGKSDTIVRKSVSCVMRVYDVSAKDILDSGGVFIAGDIQTDSLVKVLGYDNKSTGSPRQGDLLTYRGQKYQVVGIPRQVPGLGGRIFTKTHWRKV
jgi:hypothetical protein